MAVVENIGVARAEGVIALIPLSFNMAANPQLVENVVVEFLLDNMGVVSLVGTRLLAQLFTAVDMALARTLKIKSNNINISQQKH